MSRKLARYAIDLADKAASISRRQDRPKKNLEVLVDALRYEAIDTAFTVLKDIVAINPPPHDHGIQLLTSLERPSQTLVFDNGRQIERMVVDGITIYQMEVTEEPSEDHLLLVDTLMSQLDDLLLIGDLDFGTDINPLHLLRGQELVIDGKGGRAAIGNALGSAPYLTTNERIALAVQAGHKDAVMEYLTIHNNGDDADLQVLNMTVDDGVVLTWDKLPSYGVAAVDCYLTHLGIPLRK